MADIAVIDNKVTHFSILSYYHSSRLDFGAVPCEVPPHSKITTLYLLAFRKCMWSTHFQALLTCCLIAIDLSKALYL